MCLIAELRRISKIDKSNDDSIIPELEHLKIKRKELMYDISAQKALLETHNKRMKVVIKAITHTLMARKKILSDKKHIT